MKLLAAPIKLMEWDFLLAYKSTVLTLSDYSSIVAAGKDRYLLDFDLE